MASERATYRVEWADQCVTFACPCGSPDRVPVHFDSDGMCPDCGRTFSAHTDIQLTAYCEGEIADEVVRLAAAVLRQGPPMDPTP